ncbi:MAG: gamma-glutamyl-gamma-aminobutyrate hydrolase family protein [Firmicutes bacterium]|nr:gamma-glutamyl-gamma-aminobutyrate hydrolase family protein [Bacillota bacterium]
MGVGVISRPAIGITVNFKRGRSWLPVAYSRSVEAAGGLPLLIPPLEEIPGFLWSRLQGIIFSGGGDISPLSFGQEPLPGLGKVDPGRDKLELALAREALCRDFPLLGICRGMQLLNVAAGGTIVQHLEGPAYLQHLQESPRSYPSHTVTIIPCSRLSVIIGKKSLPVNSFHHQAVEKIATGFCKAAIAPDGVVEALESHCRRFVLGVQWHPETLDHPSSAALFRALVESAG